MYRFEIDEVVCGDTTDGRAGAATTESFGEALLALYEAVRTEPEAACPPERVGSLYFHPLREGVALEDVNLQSCSHGVVLALVDKQTGDTWFRTVDLSVRQFQDAFRGPFLSPLRSAHK